MFFWLMVSFEGFHYVLVNDSFPPITVQGRDGIQGEPDRDVLGKAFPH